jgi:hypothetical protein
MRSSFERPDTKKSHTNLVRDELISVEDIERSSVVTLNEVSILLLMLYFIIGILFYTLHESFTTLDSVCKCLNPTPLLGLLVV